MATTLEENSLIAQQELPEVPAEYDIPLVRATFTDPVIGIVDAHQRSQSGHENVLQPVPKEINDQFGKVLPMLTFNTVRLPQEVLEIVKADKHMMALKEEPRDQKRPRAICARRTIIACMQEPDFNPTQP